MTEIRYLLVMEAETGEDYQDILLLVKAMGFERRLPWDSTLEIRCWLTEDETETILASLDNAGVRYSYKHRVK